MRHLWREDDQDEPSVFQPEHLLREARRQRGLPAGVIPALGVLDPDGDLVRHLRRSGRGRVADGWACYHTEMVLWTLSDGTVAGVVGCAVGAPFAVLVAEQLVAWGCRRLVSVTSAGRIGEVGALPATILIEGALRDEGTSGHYLPPGSGAVVRAPDAALLERIAAELGPVRRGLTWTTDAPYRETARAIAAARARGAVAVEMEAAALYAFGRARGVPVACFAQVTNTMGQDAGEDFEKGEADGALAALRLIEAAARAFRREAVAFLLGASDDHLKLGLWRFGFALLFLLLLAGSVWAARRAWRAFPEQRRAANLLIWLCRVLIGVMWFQGSLWKLPFPVSGGLEYWTQQMVENAAYPFVAGLVQSLALPHMDIVTPLVFALELGLAVAYMLGLFVRPAATLGALYALGLWLGLYRHPGEWPWEYIFLAVLQAQFAIFAAGRRLGLDALWRTRRPDVFREDIPRTA